VETDEGIGIKDVRAIREGVTAAATKAFACSPAAAAVLQSDPWHQNNPVLEHDRLRLNFEFSTVYINRVTLFP